MSKPESPTRRGAIAGLAAAAGAAFAACKKAADPFGRARDKPPVPGARRWSTHEERWAVTSCAQCAAGCGIRVRVVEGRAVRIEGNPENPLNRGGVGPRGLAGLQALYDPDRITGPMIRRGGALSPATWDEALDLVAGALRGIDGRDLLVISGLERGMTNDLFSRLCRAAGGGRFIDGRPAHAGPIAKAMAETFGAGDIPAYDWAGAKTVLSLEAGLLEDSCQAVYFARMAAEYRGRDRARIIHAGPSLDLSAYNADAWIRMRPGTSGALALGLARVLLSDGTVRREALEQASGVAGFEKLVESFSLERTAAITGIAADAIAGLARTLWAEQPSFALVDDRSVGFTNGVDTARAALALNVLLGAVEAPHGGVRLPIEPPLRSWPEITGELAAVADFESALALLESPRPPKLALLYYANPIFSRANPDRWRAALERVEMVVTFSPFLDETTAEVAALVLPDHTYLERRESADPAPGLPRAVVGVRQPVVEPLHDTRATGDAILEIGRRAGGEIARAMPWRRFAEAVDARLLGLHDARTGSIQAPGEREFLDRLYEAGVWSEANPPPARAVAARLPESWREPEFSGEPGAYPLRLLVYRPLGHTLGGGANLPWLQQLKTRPGDRAWRRYARVHPSSAAGIADGEKVEITSDSGSITMPVHLDERIEPGVIAVPLGGGHTAFGRFARGLGANPMRLLPTDVLCSARVKIARST